MRKQLTDQYLKSIKAPPDGRIDVADIRCSGLSFRVTAAGARSWNFRFRDPKTSRQTRATIGPYPSVSLGEARARADALRATVAAGDNPVESERRERRTAHTRSFEALAERFMTEHSRRKKRSSDQDERNLTLHILPLWRSRQIEDIRRADVIELIEGLVKGGKPVLANRVQALISTIFSFAVDLEAISANPCSRLKKRGIETAKTRVLSNEEIRLFWRHGLSAPMSKLTGLALRLQLLTGSRPSEAAGVSRLELIEIHDRATAAWLRPEIRVKTKNDHIVPLSSMAFDTVHEALELIAEDDSFLFPSPVNREKPIDGHALARAMSRLAFSGLLEGPGSNTWKADPPTPHDFRRTCETRMSSLGVPKEDRDACLNHARNDIGSRHYDMYDRFEEKKSAFTKLSDHVFSLIREIH